MGSSIRLTYKLTKFLIKISNKMYKPKTYDKAIDNLMNGNI